MSTFQAAFLNEVIYVTNARFKEGMLASCSRGLKTKAGLLLTKKVEKKKEN